MAHYKVMLGTDCYGRGTREECDKIVQMHKTVKAGSRKESAISLKTLTIEADSQDYPFPAKPLSLGYVPSNKG
jgi:hypothetical protein